MKFKCFPCKLILDESELIDGNCPICERKPKEMCKLDHNNCIHEVAPTIAFCSECGAPMCPECGCHDVVQISRVTGYLQEVSGWNSAKRQELKDRQRYQIV